jgi:glycerophosphoryl diester phosphodiesterase
MAAFERALQDGAAGVELDVRLAGDGVPVVIHDAKLRRTGLREGTIAKMTSREICQTDIGSWFNFDHPPLARTEYSRQVVPTLAQVFDLCKHSHRSALIYVEMKTDKAEDTFAELASAVVQLVNDRQLRRRVVIVSFNLKALARVKRIDAGIATGALFAPRRNLMKTIRNQPAIKAALQCGADQILLHRLIATKRLVNLALENTLRPVVWTVDDSKWIRRATSLGLHALITNNPGLLVSSI